jgi:hypothetical protein
MSFSSDRKDTGDAVRQFTFSLFFAFGAVRGRALFTPPFRARVGVVSASNVKRLVFSTL